MNQENEQPKKALARKLAGISTQEMPKKNRAPSAIPIWGKNQETPNSLERFVAAFTPSITAA